MEITQYQKLRISVLIKNQLNDLSEETRKKMFIYSDQYDENKSYSLIAKKTNIKSNNYYPEAGVIQINELLDINMDELHYKLYTKPQMKKVQPGFISNRQPEFNVSQELKDKTKLFEENNVKDYGASETLLGELFRSLQHIEYRAYNDGDLPWLFDSPSFQSYLFMNSIIDTLNVEHFNNMRNESEFRFTDEFLKEHSWDNKISTLIESKNCYEVKFIKYQLIDLLESGQLIDEPNKYDSRNFLKN